MCASNFEFHCAVRRGGGYAVSLTSTTSGVEINYGGGCSIHDSDLRTHRAARTSAPKSNLTGSFPVFPNFEICNGRVLGGGSPLPPLRPDRGSARAIFGQVYSYEFGRIGSWGNLPFRWPSSARSAP